MNIWHAMGAWGWAMMAFGVLFWVAVVALAVWLVREFSLSHGREAPKPDKAARAETAREVLDRRFAAGDLDLDSYTRAVEALARGPGAKAR